MIDILKKFLSKSVNETSHDQPKDAAQGIRIATCALLLEMSNIDGEFSESEKEYILSMMKHDYGLTDEESAALMAASSEELEKSIDLWRFAQLINQNYTEEEKERVIEMVWRIAYADGHLEKHEDYLVHKLAKLLRLSHSRLIAAKVKVIGK